MTSVKILFSLALLLVVTTGCRTSKVTDIVIGPDFVPKNSFVQSPVLPEGILKVAVLPITGNEREAWAVHGRETLESPLLSELNKLGKFETYALTRIELKEWLGKESFRAEEELPADFFKVIQAKTGADAVLFAHLTHYNPYPPLIIGWRMKLVQVDGAQILWAVDEVLDAGEEPVTNSARRYAKSHLPAKSVLDDSRSILIEPAKFGRFTASALLKTMPTR